MGDGSRVRYCGSDWYVVSFRDSDLVELRHLEVPGIRVFAERSQVQFID